MSRSRTVKAIILKTYPLGEQHRGVVFVTPDRGILRAIAHGAASPRGKLRSAAIPFARGILFLYEDPVRNSIKLTDADIEEYHPGLRESYEALGIASLWAELALSSHMEGDNSQVFYLLQDALLLLSGFGYARDDGHISRILTLGTLFLWRFIAIAGLMPDLQVCSESGRDFASDEEVFFAPPGAGLIAREVPAAAMGIPLMPGARNFLQNSFRMELKTASAVGLPKGALGQLFKVGIMIVQDALGKPLVTLKTLGPGLFR
ncbi:DNA repair protein RecO [Spirochaeta lutea]|uniref:DNA repair protein RecO n=1 Tax=Spirochaeta lutea TaxID=1480694 RepID=UPI000ABF4779|nr:DNA repair protein RecO [Spirochaeta lutea]